VQCEVCALTQGSYLDNRIDWEVQVFRSITTTFDIHEDLGICEGDAKYVSLLATVLMLAYELLQMAVKRNAPKARSLLSRALNGISSSRNSALRVLEAERKRLTEELADIKVLRVIQDIGSLLPSI
jgi:hypothetical protein